MKIIITGGAGFIGSKLAEKLSQENEVIIVDNLSTGKRENIPRKAKFLEKDISKEKMPYIDNVDMIFHLAANPDIRTGEINTNSNIDDMISTYNVLEYCKNNKIKKIIFASSSTVYGYARKIPTPENYSPMVPISVYGASKLSCESLIMSYSNMFEIKSWIFRFANVVGPTSNRGVIIDFIRKLKNNSSELEILGDGRQKKSYIFIDDCIDAILFAIKKSSNMINIFNLGSEDFITVDDISRIIISHMNLKNVSIKYTGTEYGWKGDVTKMRLSIRKIKKTGWKPKYNSKQSIERTVKEILS